MSGSIGSCGSSSGAVQAASSKLQESPPKLQPAVAQEAPPAKAVDPSVIYA
jgi:hypothetical protein